MKEREIRVLFLGLDNAGKSSLLCTLTSSSLKEVAPTLGFDIKTIDWLGKFKLHVWDVGGQETIRTYWRNYFEETDALVWVSCLAEERGPNSLFLRGSQCRVGAIDFSRF